MLNYTCTCVESNQYDVYKKTLTCCESCLKLWQGFTLRLACKSRHYSVCCLSFSRDKGQLEVLLLLQATQ